ncbi:MAG: Sjogren's syndrome/scleroderma autoantigen 1 family protein [Promethearchaeota archaeon]
MADLLRLGHTMLNIACPVCNNPIFRNKSGEKYCPSCDRKVVIMNENNAQTYQKNTLNSAKNLNLKSNFKETVFTSLEEGISTKIQWLIEKLRIETDIELLRNYINLISNLLDLLDKGFSTFTKA